MTEEKLVEEILEIASELDRGDITFDEAQEKAELLVRIDRYEQLLITDVVLQSEQLCDNPHCEDGIVDRDMYGHPIYCQVCDSHN